MLLNKETKQVSGKQTYHETGYNLDSKQNLEFIKYLQLELRPGNSPSRFLSTRVQFFIIWFVKILELIQISADYDEIRYNDKKKSSKLSIN